MKDTIRDFLLGHITEYDLQDDDDIFELGLVNSLFAMQLVLFVEQAFDISIDGEDLDFANFRTVNAIEHLVRAKTGIVVA
jgi:methoxymalonate biosynthesis acyl carrier protein